MIRLAMRRGALLPMVLIVMVIIALAAGAALFASGQDRRASWNARLQTTALAAADRAHADALSELAGIAPGLAPGGSVARELLDEIPALMTELHERQVFTP